MTNYRIQQKVVNSIAAELYRQMPIGEGHAYNQWLMDVSAVANGIQKMEPRIDRLDFLKNCGMVKEAIKNGILNTRWGHEPLRHLRD